jgi:hypothetical protein
MIFAFELYTTHLQVAALRIDKNAVLKQYLRDNIGEHTKTRVEANWGASKERVGG